MDWGRVAITPCGRTTLWSWPGRFRERRAAPEVPSFAYIPLLEDFCLPKTEKIVRAVRELSEY